VPLIILEIDNYAIAVTIDLGLQHVTSAVGLTVCSSYAGGSRCPWNCFLSIMYLLWHRLL